MAWVVPDHSQTEAIRARRRCARRADTVRRRLGSPPADPYHGGPIMHSANKVVAIY
jgi:hypothetical protein